MKLSLVLLSSVVLLPSCTKDEPTPVSGQRHPVGEVAVAGAVGVDVDVDSSLVALNQRIVEHCLQMDGVSACTADLSPNQESGIIHITSSRALNEDELESLRSIVRDDRYDFAGKLIIRDTQGRSYHL